MKVYISGKITGDADYKQKFKTAQNILESAGFEVFNPAEQEDTGKSWTWYMRKDIAKNAKKKRSGKKAFCLIYTWTIAPSAKRQLET